MRRPHRHRLHRRRRPRSQTRALQRIAVLGILGAVLYTSGSWVLARIPSFGGPLQHAATQLHLEDRGTVRVSLEGGEWQQATQELKLYPDDKVSTGPKGAAVLSFFDGSIVRLDEETTIRIEESAKKEEESQLSIELESGSLWFAAPTKQAFSGAIKRAVSTQVLAAQIPSRTEAVIKERSIAVFDGDDVGTTLSLAGTEAQVYVGEGQMFSVPDGTLPAGDVYDYRSALDPTAILSPFVEESREQYAQHKPSQPTTTPTEEAPDTVVGSALNVSEPEDQSITIEGTINVSGSVSEEVAQVRVNGYNALIDEDTRTFALELALPDEKEVTVTVEALADDGEVLKETIRTVFRDLDPPDPPEFLRPAKTGETYQTQQTRIEIIGEAPEDAIGIIVNDYRLQFFSPGDTTWKYLASTDLNNFKQGENIFTAKTIKEGGVQSTEATMTIILGEGEEGVVKAADGEEVEPEEVDPDALPNNEALSPGSLQITSPTNGPAVYTATETELFIEGIAPEGATSMWVNDYKLRLFKPENRIWNYIASTDLGTMKRGSNQYVITARNSAGEIIDRVIYIIKLDGRNIRER